MCGIFGCILDKPAAPILLKGLRRLEYRGYDSAGMATVGSDLVVKKDVGRVDEINQKLNFEDMPGTIGIAHTRWATHGGVTQINAHPHLSNNKKIAVAHNGIVENYQELRDFLKGNGFTFISETDTEVIPNLIEYEMSRGKNFEDASIETIKKLEGNYAILAIHSDERKIVAARNGSPLVIGVGENEIFPASDIPSFLEYTKNVIYLKDKDVVILEKGKRKIFNLLEGREVERPISTVNWSIEEAEKGNFDHYMLKEISEQVETIQRAAEQDREAVDLVVNSLKEANGIFLVACGSSYHAALSASYVFSKLANLHINVVLASEFSNYEHFLTEKTLIIAVSQSGETSDVLEAIKTAKKKNAKVISIVNVMGSSLHRSSDQTLLMNAGPEICVLSTKTYTSQIALLNLLAYAFVDKFENGKRELKFLWNAIYNLTSESTRNHIKVLAEKLKDKNHIFTIGRGLQYPTALEAALKLKEVSYIHAEGFSGGELKHGTIALIEEGTPCIVFVSKENEREILSNAMEIKSRGGFIVGVAEKNNEVFDFFIKVPDSGNLNPICQIIPMQILAYHLAVLRGCDPDHPRNLAKSCTVK